jgi:hypothetical protein
LRSPCHYESENHLAIQRIQLPVGFFIEIAMALTHVALQQDGSVLSVDNERIPLCTNPISGPSPPTRWN